MTKTKSPNSVKAKVVIKKAPINGSDTKVSSSEYFKFQNVSEIKKPFVDFSKHYPNNNRTIDLVPDKEKGEPLVHKNIGSPDDDGGARYNQIVP